MYCTLINAWMEETKEAA